MSLDADEDQIRLPSFAGRSHIAAQPGRSSHGAQKLDREAEGAAARRRAQVLYIVGSGRTGSSLIDVLLGLHSDVVAAGEICNIPMPGLRCPCGSRIDRCPHWTSAGRLLGLDAGADGGMAWERLPLAFNVGAMSRTRREALTKSVALFASRKSLERAARISKPTASMVAAARNSWMLYDTLAEVNDAMWVVDNSKTPGRLRLLAVWEPSRIRALHLVRDGRAVTESLMRHYRVSMRQAIWGWLRRNLVAEAVLRALPGDSKLLVRYEDCASDPAAVGQIFRFMGLPEEPVLDRLADAEIHSIPGSPSLYNLSRKVVPDLRWQTQLSRADLATFERVGGWLNRRYGYSG